MTTTTEGINDYFSLEGPMSVWASGIVVLALLTLFSWSLWKERAILGSGRLYIFWVLRATALLVAVWMLLAPTRTQVEVATSRKSVAILVDVSGSMQTVDPAGSADDIRWQTAAAGASASETLAVFTKSLDSASAAAAIAERHLKSASMAVVQHQRQSLITENALAAQQAISHVREHLSVLSESEGTGSESLTKEVMRELSSSEFEAFDELCHELSRERTPSDDGWRESLADLQIRIAALRRQLTELSKQILEQNSQTAVVTNPSNNNLMASDSQFQNSSRLQRVLPVLERLSREVMSASKSGADFRISVFDQSPRPVLTLSSDESAQSQQTGGEDASAAVGSGKSNPSDAPSDTQAGSLTKLIEAAASANPEAGSAAEGEPKQSTRLGTDLSLVLEQLDRQRREESLAAAIIFTDASHNQSGSPNPRLVAERLKGLPVYVVPIGNSNYVRDALIQSVFCPTVAMRNDEVVIEAVIQAYECEGETCVVELLQDGTAVESRTIALDSSYATRRVRFDKKLSEIGVQKFQIRLTPLEGELSELNNVESFEVNVTRSEIRLLLADDMPRWEYRYLAQLFRRDPKVSLDELLFHPRVVATGRRESSSGFPLTADDWDQYDAVILGDLKPDRLTTESQIALMGYLRERGGTAIVIAGKESMPQSFVGQPLIDILPVTRLEDSAAAAGSDNGYAFLVTEPGRSHSALMIGETEEGTRNAWEFVNEFAPLQSLSPWRLPRPSATTLISAVPRGSGLADAEQSAANSAFLCWQPVGRGRIVYLSGPETFRLRYLRGDLLHYRFWGQMLRWALASDLASGSDFIRIKTDKTQYSTGEAAQVSVQLMDAEGRPVQSASPVTAVARVGEQERTVVLKADERVPGTYLGELSALIPGEYELEAAGSDVTLLSQGTGQQVPRVSFSVTSDLPAELLDTRCDRALAQQIADLTGGQVLSPASVAEVVQLTDLKPVTEMKAESRPLWVEWKYLWIVFGCLQTEWIVRKVKGLS